MTVQRGLSIWYGAIIAVAALLLALALRNSAGATGLVGIFEMRYGTPGMTRVLPECGCTVKYVGTRVDGRDYFVHFKKLD